MQTNLSIILICLLVSFGAFAQHNTSELPTSINEAGTPPDNSAMLDIQSSNKGVLIPRMTYAEIRAIPSPAEGLMAYDTDSHCLKIFNGTSWDCLYQKLGLFRGQQSISMLGGRGSQYGYDIAADASGNVYVVGNYDGTTIFGNTTLPNTEGRNVFIVKYDSSGTVVWAEAVTVCDQGYSIAVSPNGDVYVTGIVEDSDLLIINTVVAKYNSSGTLQWMEQTTGTEDYNWNQGHAIDVDSNGDVYVTGYFANMLIFSDGTTLTSNGGGGIFISKYSSTGALLWAKNAGGTSYATGEGLVLDNAGNIYLTGQFRGTASFGALTISSAGNDDVFIAKYDTNGNEQWVKSAGGNGYDSGQGITLDNTGNVYVVGSYSEQADFDGTQIQSAIGGRDAFVAAYDNQGGLMWAKGLGGGGSNDEATGVATDTNGNIYLTGYFRGLSIFGNGINLEGSSGYFDAFIAKSDSSGNLEWIQRAGNDGTNDRGTGVVRASNGDIYVTGYLRGIALFGEDIVIGEGNSDVFIVKCGQ